MKRFLVGVAVTLFLLITAATGVFLGVGYYLSPQDNLVKSDAIVAVSGGDTESRTKEAVRLYQDGWADHLVFSGAALDPNSPSNAQAMAIAAEKAGVPFTAITLDEVATNTRQNAAGVASIIHQQGFKSIILVTSPYHQRRADILFQRALGGTFPITSHSSYDQDWRRSRWWATAQSRKLTYSELQKVAYELATGQAQ